MAAAKPQPPTLPELRELLEDVYHEIENHGAETSIGDLCSRAYDALSWLVIDYLTPEEARRG